MCHSDQFHSCLEKAFKNFLESTECNKSYRRNREFGRDGEGVVEVLDEATNVCWLGVQMASNDPFQSNHEEGVVVAKSSSYFLELGMIMTIN